MALVISLLVCIFAMLDIATAGTSGTDVSSNSDPHTECRRAKKCMSKK